MFHGKAGQVESAVGAQESAGLMEEKQEEVEEKKLPGLQVVQ